MENITKRFGSVVANDSVSFDLYPGEVHALLGENGAGKTTLMSILYGLYKAQSGRILLRGNVQAIHSPASALACGIGMVQQHFTSVPSFSVSENGILGLKDVRFFTDTKEAERRFMELSEKYLLALNPSVKAWQLTVVEKQRLEILKLLYLDTKIIILDEPTAVLTPQESHTLFKAIRIMKENGASVVFISHKLKEVMEISDRITVLRNGKNIGTTDTKDTDFKKLANWMVGREVIFHLKKAETENLSTVSAPEAAIVLELKNVSAESDKNTRGIDKISLQIKSGEILGMAGVGGNGQRELAESIYGLRSISEGEIFFQGKDISFLSIRNRLKKGLCYIPQDRKTTATCPELSLTKNVALRAYLEDGFWQKKKRWKQLTEDLIQQYSISTPSADLAVKYLSGGNMQKLIIGRELMFQHIGQNNLIIAEHPTRGLDIGAMEFVYNTLLKAKSEGAAILLIAGDLDEIFAICDRVAVMYEGRIIGYAKPEQQELEKIGLMMAGVVV